MNTLVCENNTCDSTFGKHGPITGVHRIDNCLNNNFIYSFMSNCKEKKLKRVVLIDKLVCFLSLFNLHINTK